uniref:Cell wall hydroxyproline-rich glycoprotein n=1 Tax=Oryza barthii TaxID=65489 RepID=A0A0D3ENM9_9ORYZ
MGTLPPFPPLLLLVAVIFSFLSSSCFAVTSHEAAAIARRQLLNFEKHGDHVHIDIDIEIKVSNPRLAAAHRALHALKRALYSDPGNFTGDWAGPDVCAYNGVLCAPSPDNASASAVASLDMNAADVAGYLPREIGLLSDLAVLHLNSNRFCGVIPEEVANMTRLYELDVSNNRLVGAFPGAVLRVPELSYLDIRFNDFDGPIPPELFLRPYDAIFLNNNRFTSGIPDTIGRSTASVIVLANNDLGGCIPPTIGQAAATLDQFVFLNNSLTGCLPLESGLLANATVFDVSHNLLTGAIPATMGGLAKVEQLDLSHNTFTGDVPGDVCGLPALTNLSVSYNFFAGEDAQCSSALLDAKLDKSLEDEANCMGNVRPMQRSAGECAPVVSHPVDCSKTKPCGWPAPAKKPAPESSKHSPPPPPPPAPIFNCSTLDSSYGLLRKIRSAVNKLLKQMTKHLSGSVVGP